MTMYRLGKAPVSGMISLVFAFACVSVQADDPSSVELGQRIYADGILPSGEEMQGLVSGDVEIAGDFVICGRCHRRSGLGSIEGSTVVPIVVGSLLYEDLRLPTSRPPAPPVQRPAYTRETLARSIRDGIGSDGKEFSVLMPRYELSDSAMDNLLDYLESLSVSPAPGVTEIDIHFATIVSDNVSDSRRKAMLDVLQTFFQQKNSETRYETKRATSGPWHKDWVFKPYRKWVLHIWELSGPQSDWPDQLQLQYNERPVFAVLNGTVEGGWQPIHDFCEQQALPCLFPSTDLPGIDESDFYSAYLSKGVSLEAAVLAKHLRTDGEQLQGGIVQVFVGEDAQGVVAAQVLRDELGDAVTSFELPGQLEEFQREIASQSVSAVIAWLGPDELDSTLLPVLGDVGDKPLYLAASFVGDPATVPDTLRRNNTHIVFTKALPTREPRLLARSTGWFRAKRIYAPDEKEIQANAYFVLKVAGGALVYIGGFFNREYFLESVEHMIDNAIYTSVYPHMSLAPEQRFVSKGGMVAQFVEPGSDQVVAVTQWLIPE